MKYLILILTLISLSCQKENSLIGTYTIDKIEYTIGSHNDGNNKVTFQDNGHFLYNGKDVATFLVSGTTLYFNGSYSVGFKSKRNHIEVYGILPSDIQPDPSFNSGVTTYLSH